MLLSLEVYDAVLIVIQVYYWCFILPSKLEDKSDLSSKIGEQNQFVLLNWRTSPPIQIIKIVRYGDKLKIKIACTTGLRPPPPPYPAYFKCVS
jgi:hypothetical protein